jgi:prepilin-type N-terminal cleavage/methylation domain-containing protein
MPRKHLGFSLIELMIVVAIIGIIAIGMYSSYRIKAYNSQAIADIYHINLFENQFFNDYSVYEAIAISDKQASGLISKNVTLADSSVVLFEIRSLALDTKVATKVDANKQTIIIGAKHDGSTTLVATDNNDNQNRKKTLAGAFTASDLPASTSANDLSSWALF